MNISTTCCNAELIILTVDEGSRFNLSAVADEILCSAEGCNNSWNAKGVAKTAAENISTSCCDAELIILTVDDGSRFESGEVDEILCSAKGCNNSWNAKGVENMRMEMAN